MHLPALAPRFAAAALDALPAAAEGVERVRAGQSEAVAKAGHAGKEAVKTAGAAMLKGQQSAQGMAKLTRGAAAKCMQTETTQKDL